MAIQVPPLVSDLRVDTSHFNDFPFSINNYGTLQAGSYVKVLARSPSPVRFQPGAGIKSHHDFCIGALVSHLCFGMPLT